MVTDEDNVRLTAEDIANGNVSPEVIVEHIEETKDQVTPISKDDYTITRHPNRVVVKNNAKTKDTSNDLYAMIVYQDDNKREKTLYFDVTKIPAQGEESIYHMFNEKGDKQPIGETDDYTILFGRELEEIPGFATIGWYFNEETQKYEEENILDTADILKGSIVPETPIEWEDGNKVQMKAGVTNKMQIKISWAPNGKTEEKQASFKKYLLYELKEDPSAENGYKEELCWPLDKAKKPTETPSSSKSATLDVGVNADNIINSSMLYLLKCFDKDNKQVGQYVTPVAPYLLQLQSGFEFTCTQPLSNSNMAYRLQLAKVNKDNGGKVTEGFQDSWSKDDFFNDMYSIGDYPVNKNLSVRAVQLDYSNDEPKIDIGKNGFGRIKTVAYINGNPYVSAPSNVISCKDGPETCYIVDIAGVIYDVNDAKKNNNEKNIERAKIHWQRLMGEEPTFDWEKTYIHGRDDRSCAKSGMVFFLGLEDEKDIKAYELLRCDTENGVYKKIKTYAKSDKTLDMFRVGEIKYSEDKPGMPVYAMQYTTFTPEATYWYAVRAVHKTGSTPGSRGMGFENTTRPDVVQDLIVQEANPEMIWLWWKHDDCAKQYWLYKSKKNEPISDVRKFISENKPYAKISGGSYKKETGEDGLVYQYHEYIDKGKNVETDQNYYYFVRPIYNTKSASNPDYNLDMCSQVLKGRASARYSVVNKFAAENYGVKRIQYTFKQSRKLKKYRIFRLKVNKNETSLLPEWQPDILDAWDHVQDIEEFENEVDKWSEEKWKEFFGNTKYHGGWEYVDTLIQEGGDNSEKKRTALDGNVKVGDYYYYLVQGATNESSSFIFSYSKQIQNQPLPAAGLGSGWNGTGAEIKVSWKVNKNDDAYKDSLVFERKYDNGEWVPISDTKFVDKTLKRGNERRYWVRVGYVEDGKVCWSKESKTTCSLPVRIEVDDYREIYVGDEIEIRGRAVRSNGDTAAVHDITYSEKKGVLEGSNGKYRGNQPGEAWVQLRCAGISREVHVRVKSR